MRADKYFAEKFGSRTRAKAALEAGRISQNGKILSPSDEVSEGGFFLIAEADDFVSNGGQKLERGLSHFSESVEGKVVCDLGASTGGFCDCLLRRGASKVYCVDVGEGLLDPRLAADPRVVKMDKTNARYLQPSDFPEPIDIVTSDLSFISLKLVLPAIYGLLQMGGRAFVLFKPQFECGGKGLPKSGILDKKYHKNLLSDFYSFCVALGLAPRGIVNAPVKRGKNIEYIVFLEKGGTAIPALAFLQSAQNIF